MFRPVKIRQYVKFMQSSGYAAETLLDGTGVALADLNDSQLLMDLAQAQTVVSNMMKLTKNQGIGFELGAQARIRDLGIIGHAIISANTLRDALDLWVTYGNSLTGILSQLSLEDEDHGHWTLSINELTPSGFVYNFVVEETLVMILRLGQVLMDQSFVPARLELSYPEPTHRSMYNRYFKCPITFNSRRTRITISGPHLNQTMPGNDEEINEICRDHCQRIMSEIAQSGSLVSRLQQILLRKRGHLMSLADAANELHVSPRTLRRHLSEEGASYQQVVRDVRCELAQQYLKTTHIAPKEIAYLLGFRNADAFRRAFKSWTGKTISEYTETKAKS